MENLKYILIVCICSGLHIAMAQWSGWLAWVPLSFILLLMFQKNRRELLRLTFTFPKAKGTWVCLFFLYASSFLFVLPGTSDKVIDATIYQIIGTVLLNGIIVLNEEGCFRVFLLHQLGGSIKKKVIAISVLFAMSHVLSYMEIENPTLLITSFLVRMLLSILLCMLFIKHHSGIELILFHLSYNLLLLFWPMYQVTLQPFILLSIISIYVVYLYRREVKQAFRLYRDR